MQQIHAIGTNAPFRALIAECVLADATYEAIVFDRPDQALAVIASGRLPAAMVAHLAQVPEATALCRAVRQDGRLRTTPVLILSGSRERIDLYESFEAGASDYMPSPVDPIEFKLRLRSQLRRRAGTASPRSVRLEHVTIDLDAHLAIGSGGQALALTPREMAILMHLLGKPGRCASTEELLTSALGYPPREGNPEVIRTHVRHLREKIEPDPSAPRFLVNIPRVGYRLALPG